ncbi:putative nucleotidyltransferase substrate binding domain protein [Geobacter sp. OR-1]|uniref:putative nucleotidyltransferase substrate binding domain-containing protein n=1 Tax=Geobacter sp. OR-1 TaxID=1266765 RepID=UPI0005444590|nr:putative nucleotidyltransferase substrate binding domain-containing protein [Geobacter sp. OR-1]GAM08983.1 putative nucleotidyltransferase substrate binding domain protein [Geobacter sp. OR-1]
MALILGSRDGDIVNSKIMQELVAELDRIVAEQAAYLMPDQHRSLINGISQNLLDERDWEEQAALKLNETLSGLESSVGISALKQGYIFFLDQARSYFNRRSSVLSMHEFCCRSRDTIIRWAAGSITAAIGASPAPYAICGLGNYGREEATFTSPCDLLMIYGNTDPAGETWFTRFAAELSAVLNQLDLYAGFMRVDDPEWRGDLDLWKSRIASQAGTPDPASETVALCDLRPVFGNNELAVALRSLARQSLNNDPLTLLSALRSAAILPVGFNFFGKLKVEKSGSHRGEFNLMQFALMPMVVTVRMLAIQNNLMETATPDRIRKLQQAGVLGVDLAAKLLQAYHDFFRIKLAAEAAGKGSERDGFFLEREEIPHEDEICLKQGLDALFNLQRIVYQNVEA